jgi:transcription antitermination factor NusG
MSPGKWFIIEISEQGEGASYSELASNIKDLFGEDADFFIPTYQEKMGSYLSAYSLFDGYVFVRDGDKIRERLVNLRDFKVFAKVLECRGHYEMLGSHEIGSLKRKLAKASRKKLCVGSSVKILEGMFSKMTGEVVEINKEGKVAMVRIKTLSREWLAPIPVTSIEEIPLEPKLDY